MGEADALRLVEAVRAACITAVEQVWEEAGARAPCAEGRWELAIDTIEALDRTSRYPIGPLAWQAFRERKSERRRGIGETAALRRGAGHASRTVVARVARGLRTGHLTSRAPTQHLQRSRRGSGKR